MIRNAGAGRFFWSLATIYVVVVLLIVRLTLPGVRHDPLAQMPAMTLTLPTSLAVMRLVGPIATRDAGDVFVAEVVASAMVNIGIAYCIARYQGRVR